VRQAREIAQLHEPGRVGVVVFQPGQGFVQRDEVVTPCVGGREICGKVNAQPAAAVLVGLLAAGLIDEDAAHGLRRGGEEVNSAVPGLLRVGTDELEIRLVDQGRGLKGVSRPLAGEALRGQAAQLVVDKRQQLLGSVWVALVDLVQNPRHFGHGVMLHRAADRSDGRRSGTEPLFLEASRSPSQHGTGPFTSRSGCETL
jgi:hypothetical protein